MLCFGLLSWINKVNCFDLYLEMCDFVVAVLQLVSSLFGSLWNCVCHLFSLKIFSLLTKHSIYYHLSTCSSTKTVSLTTLNLGAYKLYIFYISFRLYSIESQKYKSMKTTIKINQNSTNTLINGRFIQYETMNFFF